MSFAPFHTWVTCLMSLPCLSQDISTSSALLGWLPVYHWHPRTFLPRNLLLCVLCVCSHASDTTVGWLSPYLQRQAQAQLQKKVKGPLELAGG